MIYLDNAASTPLHPEVLSILAQSQSTDFASPASAHQLGQRLDKKITEYRDYFKGAVNADPAKYHFIFTSSASESNTTIIRGNSNFSNTPVALSQADHPSLWEYFNHTNNPNVCWITCLADGRYEEAELFSRITSNTSLVLLSQVNNYCGTIQDISDLATKIRAINPLVHIHVDAVQAFGKIKISLADNLIDSMAISSHKIGGPKGVAGLYLAKKAKIAPLIYGGGQELGLRSSTQPFPLIAAFALAAKLALTDFKKHQAEAGARMQFLLEQLSREIPSLKFPFKEYASPYILTFLVPKISSDIILRHLEQVEIILSSSSACSSKIKGFNPTYHALKIAAAEHKSVLRLSMSTETTQDEVQKFVVSLSKIFKDLAHLW
ncbi:MAG: hypothetical protein A2504_05665 [Bdellovibrionales bacterium RIFOXYD12_FULL_39_22]|nr:MAG: hypothetical protein A2385_06160 [Bdellovibrionales bacterium RIFOXYB1_FULL_39_21]OFZ41863.1 MAG: hypothetical protein A2485_08130 [Bdellovibrionales bacterium RIFOXYC12_FULL_39_17]OFZ50579.1 MAG: hypothetical protein A2404_05080 [Bdellovibrionales bacterium RIFOXYC1_FULL_39_130]OFZ77802.1 MAG: hypothetical protein A2560_00250 [Bdellovibrionales bacterium RIFOXYD1_FULL_39_84]OFZ93762.1 MAG: hypothetical protein A2504_05665 [Bdellovibrionales bacterium RIFOXYD12_FULL_39_22]HLE11552.1 am